MKLWAISDLHVSYKRNFQRLRELKTYAEDWLIIAGDIAERIDDLKRALEILTKRFAHVIWVPGNHELWSTTEEKLLVGEAKYRKLVACCREFGVTTPEDPYLIWPSKPAPHLIVPMFLLYDYSFSPEGYSKNQALEWAADSGVVCADESHILPAPHDSIETWCHKRCRDTATRIKNERNDLPTILINHWPLRADLAMLPLIPRFSPWCGTMQTEDWHQRFNASVVVYGHLHIRRTQYRHGVRFEEVSHGYPRQFRPDKAIDAYLREILPASNAGEQFIMRHP